jgi:protein TonB
VTLTLGNTDVRYRGYLNQVQASIDRSWRWREALLAAGTAGQVLVRFSLGPDGQVEDVGVVESSGSPVLDREAADAVKRAPIPEFPRHWRLQRLNLFAQFAYRME